MAEKLTGGEAFDYIRETIECEGSMEYAVIDYTDFDNIDDAKFHELREAYVAAHAALHQYIYGKAR